MSDALITDSPQWVEKSPNEWSFTLPIVGQNVVGRAVKYKATSEWFWEAFPYQGRWGFADCAERAKTEVEKHYSPLL